MRKSKRFTTVNLTKYMSVVAGTILLTTTVAITLGAISRYFFRYPLALVAQGTYYLMPAIIALSLGYTLLNGGHVAATVLVDILPTKIRKIAGIISSGLVLAFSFFFFLAGFFRIRMAWKGHEILPGFPEITLLPFTIIPLVGLLFLFLAALVFMARSFQDLK